MKDPEALHQAKLEIGNYPTKKHSLCILVSAAIKRIKS